MLKRIFFCICFFLIVKSLFLLIGGSFDLFLNKGIPTENGPTIKSTFGYPIGIIVVLLLTKWKFNYAFKQCWDWIRFSWRNLAYFSLSFILIIILFSIILFLAKGSGFVIPSVQGNTGWNLIGLLSLLYTTLIIGSSEEIINRGVIEAYCLNKIGVIGSMLFVSFLFSLGHLYYIGILPFISAFIMSMVALILIFKTGSLYASIGMHTGWNFAYFYFEKYFSMNITSIPLWGNMFELYQIGLLISILMFLLVYKNKELLAFFSFSKQLTRSINSSTF